jgi:hypothetical protein
MHRKHKHKNKNDSAGRRAAIDMPQFYSFRHAPCSFLSFIRTRDAANKNRQRDYWRLEFENNSDKIARFIRYIRRTPTIFRWSFFVTLDVSERVFMPQTQIPLDPDAFYQLSHHRRKEKSCQWSVIVDVVREDGRARPFP